MLFLGVPVKSQLVRIPFEPTPPISATYLPVLAANLGAGAARVHLAYYMCTQKLHDTSWRCRSVKLCFAVAYLLSTGYPLRASVTRVMPCCALHTLTHVLVCLFVFMHLYVWRDAQNISIQEQRVEVETSTRPTN